MSVNLKFAGRLSSIAVLTIFLLSAAHSQTLPTARVGVVGKELVSIQLPHDFDVSKGRSLRMREVTIVPGGFLPMTNHFDRPSVSYLLKGTLTEYVEGEKEAKVITPGQSFPAFGVKRALLNSGSEPVVFLEVDLPGS
jgi:quercetin dioxygenase-like cupin family protein